MGAVVRDEKHGQKQECNQQSPDHSGNSQEYLLSKGRPQECTEHHRADHDDYIQQVRGWVLANDAELYAQAREVLAFGVIELIRPQPPLRKPTLVMTCENDSGSTPAMSYAIAAEISGAPESKLTR